MNLFSEQNYLQSKLACLLVLIILPSIVYFNSLQGAFQFDDRNLLNKEWIADLNSFNEGVDMKSFQNRPVLLWTFAINNHLDNKETLGFHLVNLTIHILVTILIFIILVRITNLIPKEYISGKSENTKFIDSQLKKDYFFRLSHPSYLHYIQLIQIQWHIFHHVPVCWQHSFIS